ncbi:MAG TPA: ATP synthase F1 subunit gamma [Ktedonobacteraceae bacterium]|jgi:F-type H+-transporting ATPase subunit gamma|nr:ATP synthase F1 subunit gamma [Ktedonobacteraceae bacterium]
MPSTREIRRRIRSTKNMAQITKAMQMVASSKMRRAQDRVQQARPYSDQIRGLVSRLAAVAAGSDAAEELELLKPRPVHKIGFLVLTPDRGLAGALPSTINRFIAASSLEQQKKFAEQGQLPELQYIAVGRRGRDFVTRTQQHLMAEFTNYGDRPALTDASAIAQVAVDAFVQGEVDAVFLVYPKFVNTVTQTPVTIQLLPVQPPEHTENEQKTSEYIYEPDATSIFRALLPRYVDVQVYQALLETIASFYSAQMVAMKNATDNAKELVDDLTLTYNKARQSAITTQILEVVAGANA